MDRGNYPDSSRANKKKMIVKFNSILQTPYYEKLASDLMKNFANVVILYGRINEAMQNELSRKKYL